MKVGDEVYYLNVSSNPIEQMLAIKVRLIEQRGSGWLVEYLDHFKGDRTTVFAHSLYVGKNEVKKAVKDFVDSQTRTWNKELAYLIEKLDNRVRVESDQSDQKYSRLTFPSEILP